MARRRKRRKGRTPGRSIDRRGSQIYEKGGQIKPLTGQRRDVASQGMGGVSYVVSPGCGRATCECPHHVTGKGCRHMAAVGYMPPRETGSPYMGRLIIGEAEPGRPGCKGKDCVRNGRDGSGRRRYRCKECRRRFRNSPGPGCRRTPPPFITPALVLNGTGMSPYTIRIVLAHMGVNAHADTIPGWPAHHAAPAERCTGPMRPPSLGSKPGAGGKRRDVRGGENCPVMATDTATRLMPAREAAADKTGHGATKLPEAARAGRAGHARYP